MFTSTSLRSLCCYLFYRIWAAEYQGMGPRADFSFPIPLPAFVNTPVSIIPLLPSSTSSPNPSLPKIRKPLFSRCLSLYQKTNLSTDLQVCGYPLLVSVSIRHIHLPLLLNTITQPVCVAEMHGLSTRVSALTVTLVLVIRKAISSIIGIMHVGRRICCFVSLASANFCSVLELDISNLWNFLNKTWVSWSGRLAFLPV